MLKGYGANLGWKAIWLAGRESGVWGGVSGRSVAAVAGLWNTHLCTTADGEHAAMARAAFCASAQQRRARDALLVRQLRDASSAARAVACEQMMVKSEAALMDAAAASVTHSGAALVPLWREAPPLASAFLAKTFWHSISGGSPAPLSVSRHWRDVDAQRARLLSGASGQLRLLTHHGEEGGGAKKRRRQQSFEEEEEEEQQEDDEEEEEQEEQEEECSTRGRPQFFDAADDDHEEEEEEEEEEDVLDDVDDGCDYDYRYRDDDDDDDDDDARVARKQRRVDFSPQDDCDLLRAVQAAQHNPRRPMWRRVLQHAHERGQLLSVVDAQTCRKRAALLFAQGRPCLAVF